MLNRLTHTALRLACYRADAAFRGQSLQLEKVQRQKLKQILTQFNYTMRKEINWNVNQKVFP